MNEELDSDLAASPQHEEERSGLEEDGDKYFREMSEQAKMERDDSLEVHLK